MKKECFKLLSRAGDQRRSEWLVDVLFDEKIKGREGDKQSKARSRRSTWEKDRR
tara:strand:- start:371 stop:532 length:162 start_codon:yes stop_codon:yes gene_type:complete